MPISPQRVRHVFRKLERDLVRIASKDAGNSVHGLRTGTRRLEILFEELLPEHDRNRRKLLKQLSKLRKRAGKVRDFDVQLTALRSLETPQEPRRQTQLTQSLIELRAQHEKKLRKSLTKQELHAIAKRLKKALKSIDQAALDHTGSNHTGKDPLVVVQTILAQIPCPTNAMPDALLHQYRKLGKRARYAAEFAAKSPQADQFIAQLKRSQDTLGDWHDWLLLQHTAADRLGDGRHSSLVAVIRNITAVKFRRAVATLPAVRILPNQTLPKQQRFQNTTAANATVEERRFSAA